MILDSGSRPSKKENIDLLYPTIRLEKTGPNLSGVSLQFPHRICSKSLQFPPPICSGRKKTRRKAKGNRRRIRKALSHEVANTAPDIQVDRPPSGAALKNGKGGGAEAVVAKRDLHGCFHETECNGNGTRGVFQLARIRKDQTTKVERMLNRAKTREESFTALKRSTKTISSKRSYVYCW